MKEIKRKPVFALFVSNRTTFPQEIVTAAMDEVAAAMKRNGIECLKAFPVADETEGLRYAAFLEKNKGNFDGVVAVFPNFGDEGSTFTALRDAGVPLLFQAGAGYLVHFIGGDHSVHFEPGLHEGLQLLLVDQIDGNLAGTACVVALQSRPAHAVGDGELSAGFYQTRQGTDQRCRIREMGEGVVDHDGVKLTAEIGVFHVAADHIDLGEFAGGDLCHFR